MILQKVIVSFFYKLPESSLVDIPSKLAKEFPFFFIHGCKLKFFGISIRSVFAVKPSCPVCFPEIFPKIIVLIIGYYFCFDRSNMRNSPGLSQTESLPPAIFRSSRKSFAFSLPVMVSEVRVCTSLSEISWFRVPGWTKLTAL